MSLFGVIGDPKYHVTNLIGETKKCSPKSINVVGVFKNPSQEQRLMMHR